MDPRCNDLGPIRRIHPHHRDRPAERADRALDGRGVDTRRRSHGAFPFPGHIVLCLFASVLLLACGPTGKTTEFTVLLPTRAGLEVGDEVRMSGFAVGKIRKIELEPDGRIAVEVRMFPKYAEHVTEGSTFEVEREGIGSVQRYLELRPGSGGPVASGARFDGVLSWDEELKLFGQKLLDSFGESALRQELLQLSDAVDRAARASAEEWEARRPELEAQGKALLERLDREGSDAAKRLRQDLEEYIEELESRRDTTASPTGIRS